MRKLLQSFLLFLSAATDKELARMVEFLKEENRILRERLPRHVAVTPQERNRLLKLGRKLGAKIKALISIVSYRTFCRWLRADRQIAAGPSRRGRNPTPADVEALILKMAAQNPTWGYGRILGELKKLGIRKVCKSTVKKLLRDNGYDPGPRRGPGTWADFVRRHAATLWACDFISVRTWTLRGVVEIYALFFIHVGSRRVYLAGMSANPDAAWMKQQARNVAMHFAEQPAKPRFLLRDYDGKFTREFDALLQSEGVEVKKVGPRAPNLSAHAERWVQSARVECLDHFVILGEAHLRHLLTTYVGWYNTCRPHQSKNNEPLSGLSAQKDPPLLSLADVRCEEKLGGLLKHYTRRAA
jgi:putative transposase